jgi:hypothetical protein
MSSLGEYSKRLIGSDKEHALFRVKQRFLSVTAKYALLNSNSRRHSTYKPVHIRF